MRATIMYGAGDVRVETVPDARLVEPTDALVTVTRAAICGSDLWPYNQMPPSESGRRMGHEFIGVVEDVGDDVRTMKKGDLVVSPALAIAADAFRCDVDRPSRRSRRKGRNTASRYLTQASRESAIRARATTRT
jgi:threonine dehydrogenase-like Zn-dependent dehydrogenase